MVAIRTPSFSQAPHMRGEPFTLLVLNQCLFFLSWPLWSSPQEQTSPMMSGRCDRVWPIFKNTGPSPTSSCRRMAPRVRFSSGRLSWLRHARQARNPASTISETRTATSSFRVAKKASGTLDTGLRTYNILPTPPGSLPVFPKPVRHLFFGKEVSHYSPHIWLNLVVFSGWYFPTPPSPPLPGSLGQISVTHPPGGGGRPVAK